MTLEDDLCNVCNAEPVIGVASSALGAMSMGYGRQCAVNGAEPLWMVMFNVEDCPVPPEIAFAEWFLETLTYRDGEYMTIREALRLPAQSDYDRFADDGNTHDPAMAFYDAMMKTKHEVAEANAKHAESGPHDGCSCSSCFTWTT